MPSLGVDQCDRRAAQGEGARRPRRDHLELAGRRREPVLRGRPVLGGRGRRGHARRSAHQHRQPQAAGPRSARPRRQAGNALYDMSSEATRAKAIGGHEPRVLDVRQQHHPDDLHRRVRAVPRAADVLDRDRRGLDPAPHRVDRRPLLAQPGLGRPADHPAAVVVLVPQQRGDVHHRPLRHRAAPRRRHRQHHVVERLSAPRQRLAVLAEGHRGHDGPHPQRREGADHRGNAARIWHLD